MRNMKKDEPPQMGWIPEPGYFRFTEACALTDLEIIESWESWFRSRKIKTIRKCCNYRGLDYIALYREDFKAKTRLGSLLRGENCPV